MSWVRLGPWRSALAAMTLAALLAACPDAAPRVDDVSVLASLTSVGAGQELYLWAVVSGSGDLERGVRWELEGGGALAPFGRAEARYTAAAAPESSEAVVRAVSLADPSKAGTITLSVRGAAADDPGAPFDLAVAGFYVTQAVQTWDRSVPLVADRDAVARAFVVANRARRQDVTVRLHASADGQALGWLDLYGPPWTPTRPDEGDLSASFDAPVPPAWLRPGLRLRLEVDPEGRVPEADESNNRYPPDGELALDVRTVPPLEVTFVPIAYWGRTPAFEPARLLNATVRMFPVADVDASMHAPVPFEAPLAGEAGWTALVLQLDLLRMAEGSRRHYMGVVDMGDEPSAVYGLGHPGGFAAATRAGEEDSETVAHELGHNWGRRHAPCGAPDFVDGAYPHPGASLGAYGLDVRSRIALPPGMKDIMSYCYPQWVSDHTYKGVLEHRRVRATRESAAVASPQRVLLVSGRVEGGRAELEPAFEVTAPPELPAPGPYTLERLDEAGGVVASVPFAPLEPEHGAGARPFAFAVPADPAARSLRVRAPSGEVVGRLEARLGPARAERLPSVKRVADGAVEVTWDAGAAPRAMVRDGKGGPVLVLAEGGRTVVRPSGNVVELVLSYGVGGRSLVLGLKEGER